MAADNSAKANFLKSLSSFSGADILVTFAGKTLGEIQHISWAIQREKAPIFTLGSADARSFSRGKRGIAGSLVFAVFDNDALTAALDEAFADIAPAAMFTAAGNTYDKMTNDFEKILGLTNWNNAGNSTPTGATASGTGYNIMNRTDNNTPSVNVPAGFVALQKSQIQYADMYPPFDIVMTFANEFGQCAFQKIYDVDILNEGSGVSVDTIVMERQLTWIARKISPIIKGVHTGSALGSVPVI